MKGVPTPGGVGTAGGLGSLRHESIAEEDNED